MFKDTKFNICVVSLMKVVKCVNNDGFKFRGRIIRRRKFLTMSQINGLESIPLLHETVTEGSDYLRLQSSEAGIYLGRVLYQYLKYYQEKIQIQLLKMTCQLIQTARCTVDVTQ